MSAAVLLGSSVAVQPVAAAATAADCTILASGGTATGTSGDDVICGSEGADLIRGYGGNDTIFGLGGDDYIDAGTGADTVQGGYGDDEILLGSGNDTGSGGPGKDRMFGQDGDDTMYGSAGDDALTGGAGADVLDGGYGVDYCTRAAADTLLSCYYDTSKPQLADVSVRPLYVDTSAAPAVLTVRARLQDTGTGVRDVRLQFDRRLADGSLAAGLWLSGSADLAEFGCTADGHAPRPTQPGGFNATICRVSGGPSDGVYELKTLLPRWTAKGTYFLSSVDIADAAGNKRWLYGDALAARGLDVRFLQTGAGDAVPPRVRGLQVMTTSVDTSASARVLGLRVRLTDSPAGLQEASFQFNRYSVGSDGAVTGWKDPTVVFRVIGTNPETCTGIPPTVAQLQSGERQQSCREAGGSRYDAWYRTWTVLPRWAGQGAYHLTAVQGDDRAGNDLWLTSGQVEDEGLARMIKQTGSGDEAAPTVSEITVTTPHVDAGVESVPVTVTARVKDGLSGMSVLFLWFWSPDGTQQSLEPWASADPCSTLNYENCRVSGTTRDGVYTMTAWLPAHAAAGTWRLGAVQVGDKAGNIRYYGDKAFGASFTNS